MKRATHAKLEHPKVSQKHEPQHSYLQLSNCDYLVRTLKLLGVCQQQFFKETKSELGAGLFLKNINNPSNSKQFFFVTYYCMSFLVKNQLEQLSMWYPPKNVNEQIQFKKVVIKMIQKLEAQKMIPKSLILSKSSLMGDSPLSTVVQFLRILSELALRAFYLENYSKQEPLVQLAVNPNTDLEGNDINKFYLYPFVEVKGVSSSPINQNFHIDALKKVYQLHIEKYRRKILSLNMIEEGEGSLINPSEVMKKLLEQKELDSTFSRKVNKQIFSQNRSFDRRIIIDKNQQVWNHLMKQNCNFVEKSETNILRDIGNIKEVLSSWKGSKGIMQVHQFNRSSEQINELSKKCAAKRKELKEERAKIQCCLNTNS